jgi:Zn-dependent M28 family amino/carboxypeptidase
MAVVVRSALALLLLALVACAALYGFVAHTPGTSHVGPLRPLSAEETTLFVALQQHVIAIATRERHVRAYPDLEAAAQYIEKTFAAHGYTPAAQRFTTALGAVRNIEVEIPGGARKHEIIVIGAHYDSAAGAPGANDNGSGVAVLLELARLLRHDKPARTVRLVAFVDEEPPFFKTTEMGSRVYAARSRRRNESIVAMFSLETMGYYSDERGSQQYPPPLNWFYPDRGNFIAFVANPPSRALMHETIAAFRAHAAFPSEGAALPTLLPGVDWSDHGSFWLEGYPAIMITDTAPYRYPHYHTPQDTPDKVDYERLARVTAGLRLTFSDIARSK